MAQMEFEIDLRMGWPFLRIRGSLVREGISGGRTEDAKAQKWKSRGCFWRSVRVYTGQIMKVSHPGVLSQAFCSTLDRHHLHNHQKRRVCKGVLSDVQFTDEQVGTQRANHLV